MSLAYRLAQSGTTLAKWTPEPVRHTLGSTIGAGSYLGWRSKRLVTRQNMAQVTGRDVKDPIVSRLALASWYNYGRYAADFMNFPNLNTRILSERIRDLSEGGLTWRQHLEAALAPGKGAVFATAHFGNWDVAGAIVAQEVPLAAVAETFADPRLNELLQSQRQDKGISIIPMEGSARRILRVFQQNQVVAIVTDRPMTPETGVPITFFGRKTYVPGGTAALALKAGAAIIPGYIWYGLRGEYYLRAFKPIFPDPEAERKSEVQRLTQLSYNSLEIMIREWPSQWYMFRPFWPVSNV
ncbi:MAG TPA: lysophospholipid acyltransferase family protein [Ktedonobacteraceae bacterium]|nr:lysophospholipid acyltransferase family protein [Ktedonobacteraceae bacterium]